MIGQECSSYEEFNLGMCFTCGSNNEHCAIMGYRSIEYKPIVDKFNRENVQFYLKTGDEKGDYCSKLLKENQRNK